MKTENSQKDCPGFKLIRRNSIKKQRLAFDNIVSAETKSQKTHYEKRSVLDFGRIEIQYNTHPRAKLYEHEGFYTLVLNNKSDETYKFWTLPTSEETPAPTLELTIASTPALTPNLVTISPVPASYTMAQLKKMAKDKGIKPEGDKRFKATWLCALDIPVPAPSPTQLKRVAEAKCIQPQGNKSLKATSLDTLAA